MRKILTIFLIAIVSFSYCGVAYSQSNHSSTTQDKDYIRHIAQKGESISSILKKYQMSLDHLLQYNPKIKENGSVSLNEILKIPRSAISTATDATIDREIKKFTRSLKKRNKRRPPADGNEQIGLENQDSRIEFYYHNVMPKETLYAISKKYNVSVDDILTANPFVVEEGLRHNAAIRIPNKNYVDGGNLNANIDLENAPSEVEVTDFQIYAGEENPDNISVAIILPITEENDLLDKGFKDLYRGFLLAADSLKSVGLSSKIDFHAVGRGADAVLALVASGQLENKDLIIGPVFEAQFGFVAKYAGLRNIPIINPLLPTAIDNGSIIEMKPADETYWDKLEGITKDKKVIHYQSENDDLNFLEGFVQNISSFDTVMIYDKYLSPDTMALSLDSLRGNVFVVGPKDNINNELLISKLVALKLAASTRDITIVASSNVAQIDEDRRGDFFKADLRYMGSFFHDRTNSASMKFETDYIDTFAVPPTLYSYRGYEIGILFLEAYFNYGKDMMDEIIDEDLCVLQVPYKFYRDTESNKLINQQWILINYKPNYSISVE